MNFNFLKTLKENYQKLKKYYNLEKSLRGIIQPDQPKPKTKSIFRMTKDEFYDYVTDPSDLEIDMDIFLHYLLDYILTSYLDGNLKDIDLKKILGLNNPYQVNRYVDKLVRSSKLQGSLLEELMKYQDSPEKADELYSLILPDYAYNPKEKELKIKNFDDLKAILKDSTEDLQKQKKLITKLKMQEQEKLRQEEYRRAVLINSPEITELIDKDKFQSEEEEIRQDARILSRELEKQKKGTVIRKAANPEKHTVISKDTSSMSPSELIAYKKKLLNKLRTDIGKTSSGGQGGTSIKI